MDEKFYKNKYFFKYITKCEVSFTSVGKLKTHTSESVMFLLHQ